MNNLNSSNRTAKTLGLVQLSLFGAIIVIMAFTPFIGYIPLGFTRATIIHIPVIIGSLMMGPKNGAILGGIFGLTSLINNTINPTATSFVFSPFISIGDMHGGLESLIICFIPRILVGIIPYYVYKIIAGKKETGKRNTAALTIAGVLGSLTNTILVMNFIYFFFKDAYAAANDVASETVYTFILGIIAMNGIPEAIVAGVLVLGIGKVLMKTKFRIK